MSSNNMFVSVFIEVISKLYRAIRGEEVTESSGTGDGQFSSGSSWGLSSESGSDGNGDGDGGGD